MSLIRTTSFKNQAKETLPSQHLVDKFIKGRLAIISDETVKKTGTNQHLPYVKVKTISNYICVNKREVFLNDPIAKGAISRFLMTDSVTEDVHQIKNILLPITTYLDSENYESILTDLVHLLFHDYYDGDKITLFHKRVLMRLIIDFNMNKDFFKEEGEFFSFIKDVLKVGTQGLKKSFFDCHEFRDYYHKLLFNADYIDEYLDKETLETLGRNDRQIANCKFFHYVKDDPFKGVNMLFFHLFFTIDLQDVPRILIKEWHLEEKYLISYLTHFDYALNECLSINLIETFTHMRRYVQENCNDDIIKFAFNAQFIIIKILYHTMLKTDLDFRRIEYREGITGSIFFSEIFAKFQADITSIIEKYIELPYTSFEEEGLTDMIEENMAFIYQLEEEYDRQSGAGGNKRKDISDSDEAYNADTQNNSSERDNEPAPKKQKES